MDAQTTAVVTIAIVGSSGVLGAAGWFLRRMLQILRHIREFLTDWRGMPARAGVPARPGAMERFERIEDRMSTVEGELRTNGGSSLRDAVNRIERTQRELSARVDAYHRSHDQEE